MVLKIASINSGSKIPSIEATLFASTKFLEKMMDWSKSVSVSLNDPFPARVNMVSASASYSTFSRFNICERCLTTSGACIFLNRKCCVRDKIVGGSFIGSVVAKINLTYSGGSSSVFKSALNASLVSMWTSSMMKILKRAIFGLYFVCSISPLISSIFRLLAASISMISICLFSFAVIQFSHTSHGVEVGPFSHTKDFAKIRAVEVFPLPLSPENR